MCGADAVSPDRPSSSFQPPARSGQAEAGGSRRAGALHARVATCTLNQWALDFDGNLARTLASCREAKAAGARYRVGPELELAGYTCEDHFLEQETTHHSAESLAALITSDVSDGMLVDVGLPFAYGGVLYNCRALLLDRKVLLIRPKTALADDLCYRESRWFTAWTPQRLESVRLPAVLAAASGQHTVPFGDALLDFADGTCLGVEMCEELFLPTPRHLAQIEAGANLIGNGNGSHHEVGKQRKRLGMITRATERGGVYLYSNLLGCDGGRMYFDGGSMVVAHGKLVAMGEQYSMREVQTVVATVDLRAGSKVARTASARYEANRQRAAEAYPRIAVPGFSVAADERRCCPPLAWAEPSEAEQFARAGAVWLWDQLRRSAQRVGWFLAVSGGADSSAVATICYLSTRMLVETAQGLQGEAAQKHVIAELDRIAPDADTTDAKALCKRLLYLASMLSDHNSDFTRRCAKQLAEQLGAYFSVVNINKSADAAVQMFIDATGKTPKYGKFGGTHHQNNMISQAHGRTRMLTAYMFATAGPWSRGHGAGTLLVLGSANSDEHNRGYNDRYDCSAADINPIGSANKQLVWELLRWASKELDVPVLMEIADATPLSETEPEEADANDEDDMGMSYPMLSRLGSMRKVERLGPLGTYLELRQGLDADAEVEMARQVKLFFFYYAQFRHLMTSMPPAMHLTDYDPDDNRHDLRPFLINCRFPRQFRAIDAELAARGLSAKLPQTTWADGDMQVPRTMGGHFNYPRRSNVEIGHGWDKFPDAPPHNAAKVEPALASLSDAELEAQLKALQQECERRKSTQGKTA